MSQASEDGHNTTWWAVISSEDLLDYLCQAHTGDDPSEVLARLYLDADERENVRSAEEDEDLDQEREYRRQVEDDNRRLRTALKDAAAELEKYGHGRSAVMTRRAVDGA